MNQRPASPYSPASFRHLLRIARTFSRYGLDEYLQNIHLLRPLAFFLRWLPTDSAIADKSRGERLRLALQDLGPVFIKFGQALSTRPDLLPPDIAQELTLLQDKVPPFSGNAARELVENAYDEPLNQHLSDFDPEPIAAASVAQVHNAKMQDGTEVVVKVLRPDIEPIIDRDIALLYTLAGLADKYWAPAERLKPLEVVEDYDHTIHDELDLMREAANASQLRVNFEGSDLIYVPKVYFDHCRRNVLVMERIDGIPIRDIDAIREAGIDFEKLGNDGVEIFFTQAFRDGFFHADMHPGNIFVSETGQYRAVDFGIMGTLSEKDKRYLAENFLAFFNRDYRAVAEAHLRAGWVPPSTRVEEFEAAIRTLSEPIFAKPIKEISFGRFLMELFRTARRFNMPLQPQLVLLQKTLFNIEGLGRTLYPDLDLWVTAKPFLERWMKDQVGPRAGIKTLKRELPKLYTLAPELPSLSYEMLRRLRDEEFSLHTQSQQIVELQAQIKRGNQRLYSVLLAGFLLALGLLLPQWIPEADLLPKALLAASLISLGIGWWRSR